MKVSIENFAGGLRADKADHLKNLNYARDMANFSVKDGKLVPIRNIGRLSYNGRNLSAILGGLNFAGGRVFFYKKFNFETNKRNDYLMFCGDEGSLYSLDLNNSSAMLVPTLRIFKSSPRMINYRLNGEDVVIATSPLDNMVVWNGTEAEVIIDAPKIKSMDLHYERLFAVTSENGGTTLHFSDDLDPTNWSESLNDAGFIDFVDERGKLLKVVSFNDYLYIFRERGITRLYANSSLQTNFYVNHLFTAGGRIIDGTIAVSGDNIFFMATDGFYRFDGANTTKILENVFPLITITGLETATYFNGKYVLGCTFGKSEDLSKNNALLLVSDSDMSVEIINGISPTDLTIMTTDDKSRLLILNNGGKTEQLLEISEGGRVDIPKVCPSFWESAETDFGVIGRTKTIRRFSARIINPDREMVEFVIKNSSGAEVRMRVTSEKIDLPLLFTGDKFSVRIETSATNVAIEKVELEVFGG